MAGAIPLAGMRIENEAVGRKMSILQRLFLTLFLFHFASSAMLLPLPQLPDPVHVQPATVMMGTATVNCSSILSGQSASLVSTSGETCGSVGFWLVDSSPSPCR